MSGTTKKLQLLKPIPSGGAKLFNVIISSDSEGNYTADKTLDEIIAAHEAGNIVRCQYAPEDGVTVDTGITQVINADGKSCVMCPALSDDGSQAYFFIEADGITLVPYSGGTGGTGEFGADGKSAYEIAKEHGFDGTEEEWLESLKGEDCSGSDLLDKDGILKQEHLPDALMNSDIPVLATNFAVIDKVENTKSVTIMEDTEASVDSDDNSAYFIGDYVVVNEDTYKLDKAAMFSIPNKHLTGNGSVAWKDWDTQPQGWKDSEDATMLSSKLKVRYADDPIYLSMKLPNEANFVSDTLVRPGMREADGSGTYTQMNNIGAVYPVDYTQLPDEVVICIGNLSLYTLSRDENAKWKLHTKDDIPIGQAMYYLPWSISGDASVRIDESKITVHDNYARFALSREDFAPDSNVAGSLAKTLHFWGEHKELDLANTRAVITFYEVWTETPEAVGHLYARIGSDQKSEDKQSIKQNFWGRTVLLQTSKTVITGHTISDAIYDELRDTPNDPRYVYADYTSSFSNRYDVPLCLLCR